VEAAYLFECPSGLTPDSSSINCQCLALVASEPSKTPVPWPHAGECYLAPGLAGYAELCMVGHPLSCVVLAKSCPTCFSIALLWEPLPELYMVSQLCHAMSMKAVAHLKFKAVSCCGFAEALHCPMSTMHA
jgi:hypothetical protein